ncbi:MAG: ABC-2 family transporter protein [Clostridiales bacterium]|nr:ABC-2 family transporter protein [Clostridiales bacterium]
MYSYPFLHISREVHEDIFTGVLSNYLVRPVDYLLPKISKFFSWMLIYFIVIIAALIFVYFWNGIGIWKIAQFCLLLFIGLVIEFSIWFIIGSLSFYMGKIRGVVILVSAIRGLLSGSLITLSFFPEWSQRFIELSPFRFLLFTPINLLLTEDVNFKVDMVSAIVWRISNYREIAVV